MIDSGITTDRTEEERGNVNNNNYNNGARGLSSFASSEPNVGEEVWRHDKDSSLGENIDGAMPKKESETWTKDEGGDNIGDDGDGGIQQLLSANTRCPIWLRLFGRCR